MYSLYDDEIVNFFFVLILSRCTNDFEIHNNWTSPKTINFSFIRYRRLRNKDRFHYRIILFKIYLPSSNGSRRPSPLLLLSLPTITIARSSSSPSSSAGGGPSINLGFLVSPNCCAEASSATGSRKPASSAADVS